MAGVGRHILDLVDTGIPGWGLRVLVPPGELADRLPDGVLVAGDFGPEFGVATSVRTLRRVVRDVQPQVVHSHLAWADVVCATALLSVPHVSTEHGIAGDSELYATSRLDAAVTNTVHRLRMRRMAATICVSEATAAEVRRRWRPPASMPLVVIPNGVDRAEVGQSYAAIRSNSDPFTVGFLGRFSPEKRPELVLSAFALVRRDLPNAILSMAGAGQMQSVLEQQADQLGLSDAVRFVGWVDAASWLRGVDVMCVTSVWENCSYAILEALAAGVGVVAAPVGGNMELLPSAALADPQNAREFADAIISQCVDERTRPHQLSGYPTRMQMGSKIAGVYARVVR